MKTFDEIIEEYKELHREIKKVPVGSQEYNDLWKRIISKRKEGMNHPDYKKMEKETRIQLRQVQDLKELLQLKLGL